MLQQLQPLKKTARKSTGGILTAAATTPFKVDKFRQRTPILKRPVTERHRGYSQPACRVRMSSVNSSDNSSIENECSFSVFNARGSSVATYISERQSSVDESTKENTERRSKNELRGRSQPATQISILKTNVSNVRKENSRVQLRASSVKSNIQEQSSKFYGFRQPTPILKRKLEEKNEEATQLKISRSDIRDNSLLASTKQFLDEIQVKERTESPAVRNTRQSSVESMKKVFSIFEKRSTSQSKSIIGEPEVRKEKAANVHQVKFRTKSDAFRQLTPDLTIQKDVFSEKSTPISKEKFQAALEKRSDTIANKRTSTPKSKNQKKADEEIVFNEIEKLEKSIPQADFKKLVNEIGKEIKSDVRFDKGALEALQFCTEEYVTKYFQFAGLLTNFRGGKELIGRDFEFAKLILKFQEQGIKL